MGWPNPSGKGARLPASAARLDSWVSAVAAAMESLRSPDDPDAPPGAGLDGTSLAEAVWLARFPLKPAASDEHHGEEGSAQESPGELARNDASTNEPPQSSHLSEADKNPQPPETRLDARDTELSDDERRDLTQVAFERAATAFLPGGVWEDPDAWEQAAGAAASAGAGARLGSAQPFASPTGKPFPGEALRKLAVALGPLKRDGPDPVRRRIVEDATAERWAEWNIALRRLRRPTTPPPVYAPVPRRMLEVAVLIDAGPTMGLWREVGREISRMLKWQGAFRDVRVYQLDASRSLPRLRGAAAKGIRSLGERGERLISWGELMPARGDRLILALTDGLGPAWMNGTALDLLGWLGRHTPVAIWHLLPENLWHRSCFGEPRWLASGHQPFGRNDQLMVASRSSEAERLSEDQTEILKKTVPLPIVAIGEASLRDWARMASGLGSGQLAAPVPAIRVLPRKVNIDAAADLVDLPARVDEPNLPAYERLLRFKGRASGDAQRLAHLASHLPLTPRVLRLVQTAFLPESGPGILAELLMSPLVEPVPGAEGEMWRFHPGVPELLLDSTRASDTQEVLERFGDQLGVPADPETRFDAFLQLEGEGEETRDGDAPVGQPSGSRPDYRRCYALLGGAALRRLGYLPARPRTASMTLVQQEFRVFISASHDVDDERAAVRSALQKLRGVRLTGWKERGSPENPDLIDSKALINASDLYVCILDASAGAGGVQGEYRRAMDRGLPCIFFIQAQGDRAEEYDTALAPFKEEIGNEHLVTEYSSNEELSQKVVRAVLEIQLIKIAPPVFQTDLPLNEFDLLRDTELAEMNHLLVYLSELAGATEGYTAYYSAWRAAYETAETVNEELKTWASSILRAEGVPSPEAGPFLPENRFRAVTTSQPLLRLKRETADDEWLAKLREIGPAVIDGVYRTWQQLLVEAGWTAGEEAQSPVGGGVLLDAGGSEVLDLAWSPDGRKLAATTRSHISVWATRGDEPAKATLPLELLSVEEPQTDAPHRTILWASDSAQYATLAPDTPLRIRRDLAGHSIMTDIIQAYGEFGLWSEDRQRILLCKSYQLTVWDLRRQTVLFSAEVQAPITAVSRYTSSQFRMQSGENVGSQQWIVVADRYGYLYYYGQSILDGDWAQRRGHGPALRQPAERICRLLDFPGELLAAGTDDGRVLFLDPKIRASVGLQDRPHEVWAYREEGHGAVSILSVNADKTVLAARWEDGLTILVEIESRQILYRWEPGQANGTPGPLAFHPSHPHLMAAAAGTGHIRLTEIEKQEPREPDSPEVDERHSRPLEGMRVLWLSGTFDWSEEAHRVADLGGTVLNQNPSSLGANGPNGVPWSRFQVIVAETAVWASIRSSATDSWQEHPLAGLPVVQFDRLSLVEESTGTGDGASSLADRLEKSLEALWEQTPRGGFYTENGINLRAQTVAAQHRDESTVSRSLLILDDDRLRNGRVWLVATAGHLLALQDAEIRQDDPLIWITEIENAESVWTSEIADGSDDEIGELHIGDQAALPHSKRLYPHSVTLENAVREMIEEARRHNPPRLDHELLRLGERYMSLLVQFKDEVDLSEHVDALVGEMRDAVSKHELEGNEVNTTVLLPLLLRDGRFGGDLAGTALLRELPSPSHVNWLVLMTAGESGSVLLRRHAALALLNTIPLLTPTRPKFEDSAQAIRQALHSVFKVVPGLAGAVEEGSQRLAAKEELSRAYLREPVRVCSTILAGVNETADSRNFPRFRFANADVSLLKRAAEELGFSLIRTLVDQEAIKEYTLGACQETIAWSEPQDLLHFHFSGYGRLVNGSEPCLIPFDARSDDLPASAITIRELADLLNPEGDDPRPRAIVTLDAGVPPFAQAAAQLLGEAGIACIAAGLDEDDLRGCGRLTGALVDGLDEPRSLTISDLTQRIRQALGDQVFIDEAGLGGLLFSQKQIEVPRYMEAQDVAAPADYGNYEGNADMPA